MPGRTSTWCGETTLPLDLLPRGLRCQCAWDGGTNPRPRPGPPNDPPVMSKCKSLQIIKHIFRGVWKNWMEEGWVIIPNYLGQWDLEGSTFHDHGMMMAVCCKILPGGAAVQELTVGLQLIWWERDSAIAIRYLYHISSYIISFIKPHNTTSRAHVWKHFLELLGSV